MTEILPKQAGMSYYICNSPECFVWTGELVWLPDEHPTKPESEDEDDIRQPATELRAVRGPHLGDYSQPLLTLPQRLGLAQRSIKMMAGVS
jgi:hypothetical protein